MREVFPYEKRYKYPHMKPKDIAIWERFIEKYPNAYKSVQYDFNVGDPPPFDPTGTNGEDLNQDALYRLKIDVVGRTESEYHIIELKPRADASAIGQLEGYKALYLRDEIPDMPLVLVIITDFLMPNIKYLCDQKGIKLFVV